MFDAKENAFRCKLPCLSCGGKQANCQTCKGIGLVDVPLTLAAIEAVVQTIRLHATYDDEYAHRMEDILHQAVLSAIASGVANAQAIAQAVLKTKEFQFNRWYA